MLSNMENYKSDNIIKCAVLAYLVHQNTNIKECMNASKLFHSLDLNHDGFYDFKNAYEYVYGEYETLDYNSSATVDGEDSATFQDTFNAVHRNGNRAINESSTVFSTSEFKGYNEVVTNTKTLTVVDSEGYGYLSMDVYLEGWDKVFTDEEQNHAFSLSLDFEAHDNV